MSIRHSQLNCIVWNVKLAWMYIFHMNRHTSGILVYFGLLRIPYLQDCISYTIVILLRMSLLILWLFEMIHMYTLICALWLIIDVFFTSHYQSLVLPLTHVSGDWTNKSVQGQIIYILPPSITIGLKRYSKFYLQPLPVASRRIQIKHDLHFNHHCFTTIVSHHRCIASHLQP